MRPTDEQVQEALVILAEQVTDAKGVVALKRLERAAKLRPVWGALEVANCLGVSPSNLRPGQMSGYDELPAPCQILPRPTKADPDKTMRLWYADEVEAFAAKRRAERSQR